MILFSNILFTINISNAYISAEYIHNTQAYVVDEGSYDARMRVARTVALCRLTNIL